MAPLRRRERELALAPPPRSPLGERADKAASPVQVSIGRVEVRAVFAPPPAEPAQPPPAAALSLDDYLEQRDAGG